MKKPSATVECCRRRSESAPLRAVAEAVEAVLDAQRLAGQAAEQHAAEDEERVRVAPRQRVVDADDEHDQAEPVQDPRSAAPACRRPPTSSPTSVPSRMVPTLTSVPVMHAARENGRRCPPRRPARRPRLDARAARAPRTSWPASLQRAGADVLLARAARPREVRTLALTDLVLGARGAAGGGRGAGRQRAARDRLLDHDRGAAVAAAGRDPLRRAGRRQPAGAPRVWQRPVERRRLREAPLLVPQDAGALVEAASPAVPAWSCRSRSSRRATGRRDRPRATSPRSPTRPTPTRRASTACWPPGRPSRREGEELVVAGLRGPGSRRACATRGRWSPPAYRALLRRASVYVTAPRREDYGIAQLEALADGARW